MTPTRPSTLVLAGLFAGLVAWLVVDRYYGEIQRLPWLSAFTVLLLAVAEGATARATRARILRKPGTQRPEPLVVARLAALAKASSLAGSLLFGAYSAITFWVVTHAGQLSAASEDIPAAAAGVIATALLILAALWLERSCRIPRDPDSEREGSKGASEGDPPTR
jgi:hypothetical protein